MDILKKNRAFFIFLAKFALSYLVLSGLYWLYLSQYDVIKLETDSITHLVARQSSWFVKLWGEESYIEPNPKRPTYRLFVNTQNVANIVEGCNAVSVIILYAAFIVAFSTTLKRTLLYIIAGSIIIYLLNIVRIGLLALGVHFYKAYAPFLHDVAFPLFIYGVVFILWIAWVTKFSGSTKTNESK